MLEVLETCDVWTGGNWQKCIAYGQCHCHAACNDIAPDCEGPDV